MVLLMEPVEPGGPYLVTHKIWHGDAQHVQSPKLRLQVNTQKAGTRGPGLVGFSPHEKQRRPV